MPYFSIVELEDGLTIIELEPGQKPQDAAAAHGGILVAPGPYANFEDATDALRNLPAEDEEEQP